MCKASSSLNMMFSSSPSPQGFKWKEGRKILRGDDDSKEAACSRHSRTDWCTYQLMKSVAAHVRFAQAQACEKEKLSATVTHWQREKSVFPSASHWVSQPHFRVDSILGVAGEQRMNSVLLLWTVLTFFFVVLIFFACFYFHFCEGLHRSSLVLL